MGAAMELQNVIGHNLKTIRARKKLTLDAAAGLAGVSRSMLAQIEKGDVNPTISVLWKIANGYKVSFTSLLDRQEQDPQLIHAREVTPLVEDEGRYVNYPAFPFQEGRLFETYRIQIAPGGALTAQAHMAGTEEYITVFSGAVEIQVDGISYALACGDSLHFRADTGHAYRNTGADTAQRSMLIYYGRP